MISEAADRDATIERNRLELADRDTKIVEAKAATAAQISQIEDARNAVERVLNQANVAHAQEVAQLKADVCDLVDVAG